MTPTAKILIAIVATTVLGAAVALVVGHFHLPQTFSSAGIGVVIGVAIALGAFSLTPKGTKSN